MSALCQKQTFCAAVKTVLFDHLVGYGEHPRRNGQANLKCLCLFIQQRCKNVLRAAARYPMV
jgi:hypothetical protein